MNDNMSNDCCNKKWPKPLVQPVYYVGATGPTGPTARCNKSSIYFFKW